MISDVSRIAGLTSKNSTYLELGPELQNKEGLLEVVACYSSLSHCLLNLIKNGREAMPNGGKVTLSWHGDYKTANITIKDQGVGMSQETLTHIFEPFFSTKKQGTGLGLAMVRGIMSQHTGTVEIRSELGVGTTVSLVWPRFGKETKSLSSTGSIRTEMRKSTKQLLRQTAVVAMPHTDSAGNKSRAYIVDDDDLVRDGLVSLMSHLGHEVKAFASPQEALRDLLSTNNPPKVLITDYNMPVMNGEQLITEYCAYARTNPLHAHVRILLMSGLPPSHFQEFINKHSTMNLGTLEKPFSMETLRKKIENVQSLRKMTTMIGVVRPSKEMKHFVPRAVSGPINPLH
jgi:CheY-like chemotaxis protein